MMQLIKNKDVSNGQLKILALISMTIDHIGAIFFPDIILFRILGRIAFPIYCFLIVEGFYYTSSKKRYFYRLMLLAFISEIPFDLAFFNTIFFFNHQNVFFTLAIGLLVITICDKKKDNIIFSGIVCISGMILAFMLNTDYSYYGILMICFFYYFRRNTLECIISQGVINIALMGNVQSAAVFALIPIELYNGRQGAGKWKLFFYSFYPIHLCILFIINLFAFNNSF